jgi:glycosyltransferase involved in cell wall biosynthesis
MFTGERGMSGTSNNGVASVADMPTPSISFRVLHVICSLDPLTGGPSEGLRQLCLAHQRLGQQCEIATLDAPDADWLDRFPTAVHNFGPGRSVYQYTPRFIPWLRANAKRFDAVVVHGIWQFHSFGTRQALKHTNTPYFVFPHGMLDPWFRNRYPLKHLKKAMYWHLAERRVLESARGVLFTTDEEAELAPQSFGLKTHNSITVGYGIEEPIDLKTDHRDAFFERWPECRGKHVILFLSRLHQKKGCDLLIDAFAAAAQRDPSLHLVMAGPDEELLQPILSRQAYHLGVSHRISWTGMLNGALKWGALQAAEAFALFSHQENFGVAVVEALASGVPVLITHRINISAAIAERHAGFVDDDTPAGAMRLMHRWLDLDETERLALRERAKHCFATLFHSDAATQKLVDEIRQRIVPAGMPASVAVNRIGAASQPLR